MSASAASTDAGPVRTMDELYNVAARLDTTPGWVKRDKPIFWPKPKTDFVPAHWSYAEVRAALTAANKLVDIEFAERRNLILRNPFPDNNFATTRTAACAYQAILPGETAPSHRHASHALRVILEAEGTYSIVNGEKTPMESGDIILTPGGSWHGHGHEGDQPAFWLDGLDIPLTHLLEPMLFEEHPARFEPVTKVSADSKYRFTRDEIAHRLDQAKPAADGLHGPRAILETPDMPSTGLTVQRLESGKTTRAMRSTANRVFVIMSGKGATTVEGRTFAWNRGDTVVVPTWAAFSHKADSDSQIFEMSDEPLMRFTHTFRQELV